MLIESNCSIRKCKHYEGIRWLGKEESSEVNFCIAFPNGIPQDIAYGDNKHSIPLKDQKNNIVYEKADK